MSRSPLRAFPLIPFALAYFALLPQARAACQDACLANFNTVLGEEALISLTAGLDNTAIGYLALNHNTTGDSNTAIGSGALYSNSTGGQNTATGTSALVSNTIGDFNTATGWDALFGNSSGTSNTATGSSALVYNITGSNNTATGAEALLSNTTGMNNTAIGFDALFNNRTGTENTASGVDTLLSNTIGSFNTGNGVNTLISNTTGNSNTATGDDALFFNTTGENNTADGVDALAHNTIGNNNTASGFDALLNNTTGNTNIALGESAGISLTTGSNNIDIGNKGVAGEANTIRIGKKGTQTKTVIAGIRDTTVTGGVAVMIDGNGRLGTVPSSARFKDNIQPMDKASEAILALKPVIFRYKKELDPEGIAQFGLVAEEVEKVNPDLVARDADGKIYTVRYEAVNAMLLNEFLKAHRRIEEQHCRAKEQEATIAQLKQDFQFKLAEQQNQIKALTTGLEKVSAQLELNKPAPQIVVNDR